MSADGRHGRVRKILIWSATILPMVLLWLWLGRPLIDRLLG
ncbi:MAG TPA: hypothetical protein VFO49_08095 [Nocardioides sp.]|nr:hypothetical protein [Nocardioides sp.]